MRRIADTGNMPRVLHASRLEHDTSWSLGAHRHPFYELISVVRGAHNVIIDGRHVESRSGDLMLYPPGHAHEEWSGGSGRFEIEFVAFEWPEPLNIPPRHDAAGRIHTMMAWLREESARPGARQNDLSGAILRTLVSELCRLAESETPGMVDTIRSFMRDRLDSPLTLDDLARVVSLSKFHFLRVYRQQSGRTPMDDLRRLRLEAARELLLTSDLPLKNIAPRVGIESEHHLSRLFASHFGLGTREFRQRVTRRAGGHDRPPASAERPRARRSRRNRSDT